MADNLYWKIMKLALEIAEVEKNGGSIKKLCESARDCAGGDDKTYDAVTDCVDSLECLAYKMRD